MSFEPVKPEVHHPPLKIADDTWLIQQMQEAIIGPLYVYFHSLVIKGQEPIIVDTGTPANREQWLKDVFSIVDPGDVRWIFVSHDDVDHAGNLAAIMEACPNATLISTWFMIERHTCDFNFPLERCRWVNDGESWQAGDRTLTAITPPLFDSPVTRGLYDDRTGVYWAVDSFATPLPGPMDNINELDGAAWQDGLEFFNRLNSPWFKLLDPDKFEQHVDRVQGRDIDVLASCHSPIIPPSKIDEAFNTIRKIPYGDPPPQPGHPTSRHSCTPLPPESDTCGSRLRQTGGSPRPEALGATTKSQQFETQPLRSLSVRPLSAPPFSKHRIREPICGGR